MELQPVMEAASKPKLELFPEQDGESGTIPSEATTQSSTRSKRFSLKITEEMKSAGKLENVMERGLTYRLPLEVNIGDEVLLVLPPEDENGLDDDDDSTVIEGGLLLDLAFPPDKAGEEAPPPHLSLGLTKARRDTNMLRALHVEITYDVNLDNGKKVTEISASSIRQVGGGEEPFDFDNVTVGSEVEVNYRDKGTWMKGKIIEWREVQVYKPIPFSTPIPFYKFPLMEYVFPNQYADQTCFLDGLGLGVVGYFKTIKSLMVIFLLMAIITLPNIILFSLSLDMPEVELFYMEAVNSQTTLATSTITALGEPAPVCREALEGQTFSMECPDSQVIQSVVAFYGQPKGSCACPYRQQVNEGSGCNGTAQFNATLGYPECVANPLTASWHPGQIDACFLGKTRYSNRCCSFTTLLSNIGDGDMSSLNLNPEPSCNSLTAQAIAQSLCQGKQQCEFSVAKDGKLQLPMARLPSYESKNALCDNILTASDGSEVCETSLGLNGVFSGCSSDQNDWYGAYGNKKEYRLIFEALCVRTNIAINKVSFIHVNLSR